MFYIGCGWQQAPQLHTLNGCFECLYSAKMSQSPDTSECLLNTESGRSGVN